MHSPTILPVSYLFHSSRFDSEYIGDSTTEIQCKIKNSRKGNLQRLRSCRWNVLSEISRFELDIRALQIRFVEFFTKRSRVVGQSIYIYIIGKVQWRDEGPVRGRLSLGKFGERLRVGITSGYGRWRSKCILMKAEEGRSKDTAKITAYVERYSRVNHHEASYVTEVHNWKTLFFPFNLQERLQSLFTFSPSAHIDS